MRMPELLDLEEAVEALSALTGEAWSDSRMAKAILELALPVYAVAPFGAELEEHRYVDGRRVRLPRPDLRSGFASLSFNEQQELLHTGATAPRSPAWCRGEKHYVPWADVKAFRSHNHHVLFLTEEDPGPWMGQSPEIFFVSPIRVTAETRLKIPLHTVQEIVRSLAAAVPVVVQADRALAPASTARQPVAQRQQPLGIEKRQVERAFGEHVKIDLLKALQNGKGIYGPAPTGARVQKGSRGGRHSALWDPVRLAELMHADYRISLKALTAAFNTHAFLSPWREEWIYRVEVLGG
jgi:hypothetical protein